MNATTNHLMLTFLLTIAHVTSIIGILYGTDLAITLFLIVTDITWIFYLIMSILTNNNEKK